MKSKDLSNSKSTQIFYNVLKRIFDIIIGFIGTVLLIPTIIIIKIISILLGDFHSIFYTQYRVGLNGKKFKLFKFRTMYKNADKELEKLLKIKKYRDEWNKHQKLQKDPRLTKLGKILRKLSIDEMPQFINILIGNMSLVGPRPLLEGELESHDGIPEIYQSVKPGIIGWWVCNGRNNVSYKKRLKLEYYYIKNRNILLDIKIIFKTFKIIFK